MSPEPVSILDASGRYLADGLDNPPRPPVPVKIWTLEPPVTAVFAFDWQLIPDEPSVPYYHIVGGERHQSTVSAETLRELGIPIPEAA